ncbi:unnamed protein product [Leuciscus chuanchicus]
MMMFSTSLDAPEEAEPSRQREAGPSGPRGYVVPRPVHAKMILILYVNEVRCLRHDATPSAKQLRWEVKAVSRGECWAANPMAPCQLLYCLQTAHGFCTDCWLRLSALKEGLQ